MITVAISLFKNHLRHSCLFLITYSRKTTLIYVFHSNSPHCLIVSAMGKINFHYSVVRKKRYICPHENKVFVVREQTSNFWSLLSYKVSCWNFVIVVFDGLNTTFEANDFGDDIAEFDDGRYIFGLVVWICKLIGFQNTW